MNETVNNEEKNTSFFKRRTVREYLAFIIGFGLGVVALFSVQNPEVFLEFFKSGKICFPSIEYKLAIFSALIPAFGYIGRFIYHIMVISPRIKDKMVITGITVFIIISFILSFFFLTGVDPECSDSKKITKKEIPDEKKLQKKDITKPKFNNNEVNQNSQKNITKEHVLNEGFVIVGSKGKGGTIINSKFTCIDGEFTTINMYGKKLVRTEKTISEVVPVYPQDLSKPIDSWDGNFSVTVISDSVLINEDGWILMKVKKN
jgi:mannitol-specific phosphotransferase system IIBC component